jgi:hypothetical protein
VILTSAPMAGVVGDRPTPAGMAGAGDGAGGVGFKLIGFGVGVVSGVSGGATGCGLPALGVGVGAGGAALVGAPAEAAPAPAPAAWACAQASEGVDSPTTNSPQAISLQAIRLIDGSILVDGVGLTSALTRPAALGRETYPERRALNSSFERA